MTLVQKQQNTLKDRNRMGLHGYLWAPAREEAFRGATDSCTAEPGKGGSSRKGKSAWLQGGGRCVFPYFQLDWIATLGLQLMFMCLLPGNSATVQHYPDFQAGWKDSVAVACKFLRTK